MDTVRSIGIFLISRARMKTVFSSCASIIAVAAFAALPATASATTASPAAATASTTTAATAFSCYPPPNVGSQFEYCNGSRWVDSMPCYANTNYNGTNGTFNVYHARNGCFWRVWLHQYTDWWNHGWAYCISPSAYYVTPPSAYQHPYNIYISSNPSSC
jgi:hypothetical protein